MDATIHRPCPQKWCLEVYQSKIRHINVCKITSIYAINLRFFVNYAVMQYLCDHNYDTRVSLKHFWKSLYLKSVSWSFFLFTTTLKLPIWHFKSCWKPILSLLTPVFVNFLFFFLKVPLVGENHPQQFAYQQPHYTN